MPVFVAMPWCWWGLWLCYAGVLAASQVSVCVFCCADQIVSVMLLSLQQVPYLHPQYIQARIQPLQHAGSVPVNRPLDFERWLVDWLGVSGCARLATTAEGPCLSPEFAKAVQAGTRWRPILYMLRDHWKTYYQASVKEGRPPFCAQLAEMATPCIDDLSKRDPR
jgi:hypothetical protein